MGKAGFAAPGLKTEEGSHKDTGGRKRDNAEDAGRIQGPVPRQEAERKEQNHEKQGEKQRRIKPISLSPAEADPRCEGSKKADG